MNPDAFTEYEGKRYFDEEVALAQLLLEGVLFLSYASEKTVSLAVNCNDIFTWGCADAEDLPLNQVEPLYEMVLKHPKWGSSIWCCLQRNEQPQAPVARAMKEAGEWDEIMEKLPENGYDKFCKEKYNKEK